METNKPQKSGTPTSIRESLKKATSELMVLSILHEKPMYTYEIMSTIEERSGGSITFNTLYQTIYRLQNFKYIREHSKVLSEDNRVRIYFVVTDTGAAYLEELTAEYLRYTGTLDHILSLKRKEQTGWNAFAG